MELAVTLSYVLVDNGLDLADPFKNICSRIGDARSIAGHRIVVKHGRYILMWMTFAKNH